MIAIAARNAPDKTIQAIGAYRARLTFFGSLVFVVLMDVVVWVIPLADPHPLRLRILITAGLFLFVVAWWSAMWGLPVRRYRTLRAKGYILEIHDPAVQEFVKGYWKPVEVYIDEVRKAERERLDATLLELHEIIASGTDSSRTAVNARIAAEQERLKHLNSA